jgi:hypothetical protein
MEGALEEPVSKVGRQSSTKKVAPLPGWVEDVANQTEWNKRFGGILKSNYENLDPTVSVILSDEKLAQMCAVKVRTYVDKQATDWLYGQRKARGAEQKKQLEIALTGMNAAIALYTDQGKQEVTKYLGDRASELSGALGRCKTAFATKRHGRDRAHSMLSECHSFLESQLGHPVTHVTLANLVNAGYEADGRPLEEPVTEEHVRKNLTTFKRNNPFWRNKIDPGASAPVEPATK